MGHEYNISEDGLELIKAYEGFRPVETVLVSGQKVIGYGHPYVRGEASLLTQKKAEDILKADLEPIEKIVNHIVFAPLSQGQFDALVSLAFNIGIDDFSESNVLHYLNNGQILAAAAGFDEWRKSIIADQTYVIDALVRRRTAEKALFLSPATGIVAAPRYEVPVLHDDTVKSGADDIEVFSKSDADGFVDQAPYEEVPVEEDHSENERLGALMLSEQVAAPQIYEDAPEEASVNEVVSEENIVLDNVVEINPEAEIEVDTETEVEIEFQPENEAEPEATSDAALEYDETEAEQGEDLSPIAIAAADVSERLDNLMEEKETEVEDIAEVVASVEETDIFEDLNVDVAQDDEVQEENNTVNETEIVETEALEVPEIVSIDSEALELEDDTKLEQPASKTVRKEKVKGAGAFWTALIVGLFLIGGSLWKMKFSPTTNMGEMGAFLAPVVLLVGAMMIMGGMLYMVKAQLRRPAG